MKSTYEKRWGHPRFRKAVKHLQIKEQKRVEAEARNAKYAGMTYTEKMYLILSVPGNCLRQLQRLHGNQEETK